jgi:spore germination cell wall hydrolase CwlJ-like protein
MLLLPIATCPPRSSAILVRRRRLDRPGVISWRVLSLAAVMALAPLASGCNDRRSDSTGVSKSPSRASPPAREPLVVPNVAADLDTEQARNANSALHFSKERIEAALPLFYGGLQPLEGARGSPLACLTAAVYYEAGGEPLQGERAVAQVVLNRVRHPSFPNTICEVVYQGSERRTGCQFTFTCDGSMARAPVPSLWKRAERVAQQALAGAVEPSVGMATHYHADWVFPYWAPTLKKITKLGPHIFYTWPGMWGRRAAFTQQPEWVDQTLPVATSSGAPVPIAPLQQATHRLPPLEADVAGGRPPEGPVLEGPARSSLVADERSGTLIVDDR